MANIGRGPTGWVMTGKGDAEPPSFMPASSGTYYSLTPYVVGQVGDANAQYTGTTALQDAIDQAVIDGASLGNQKNIYIKPGMYTPGATTTVPEGINLIGLSEKNYNAGLNQNGGDRNYNASVQLNGNIVFSGANSMQYMLINGTCTITGNLFSMLGCIILGYTLISAVASINATFTMCGFKGIQVAAVGSAYILAQDCSIPSDDGAGYSYLLQSAATFDIINCCVTGFAYFNVVGSTVNVLGGQYLARSISAVATLNINNAIVTDLSFINNSTGAIITATNCFDNVNNNAVNTSLNSSQKIGMICNGIAGVSGTGNTVIVNSTTGQLCDSGVPAGGGGGVAANPFSAFKSVVTLNVTGDGTDYPVIFDSPYFDIGSNYNTGTGIFTAPISGIYFFTATVLLLGPVVDANLITIVTTNTVFRGQRQDGTTPLNVGLIVTCMAQMTAGNTAQVHVLCSGGAKSVSVDGFSGPLVTYFSGYRVS